MTFQLEESTIVNSSAEQLMQNSIPETVDLRSLVRIDSEELGQIQHQGIIIREEETIDLRSDQQQE